MPEENKKPNLNELAFSNASEALFGSLDRAIQKYNPSILLSNKGFSTLDKMRRDDQIKAAMAFKKKAVIANGWEIVSPEGKDVDWEPTQFIIDNLKGMQGTFERRLTNIMTALDYGFSITEKVYEEKDAKIWLKAIKTKRPHDIVFSSDSFGNLKFIEQYDVKLPIEKFVIYSYEMEFDNHYGTPDLEASYRAWWTKDNAYKWFAMLLERMGIPPIFAMYDPERYKDANLTALQDVLENIQAATTATIPAWQDKESGKSIEFWAPELAKNIGDVFIPSLDMLNKDIARSILMPGLLGATPDDSIGSMARANVHFDVFMLVINSIRQEIEESVMQEQIIRPLIDMNFNVDEYPQFKFLPLTDDLQVDLMDRWIKLVSGGVVKHQPEDETHIRKKFKFPERDVSEDEDDENGNDGDDNSDIGDNDDSAGDDDGGDSDNINKNFKLSGRKDFKLSRAKNSYEKKIDFVYINSEIDSHEDTLRKELKATLKDEESYLVRLLRKPNVDIETVQVRSSLETKLAKSTKSAMMGAAKDGYKNVNIKNNFESKVGSVESAAQKWIRSRATAVSGVMSNKLQDDVRIVISNAIRSGIPNGEVIARIQDVFLPYIDSNIITDTAVITPHRVETIVRTNMTTAYNQGRLVAMRDPDVQEFIHGVSYSAIMDDRTSDVCDFLDGRVFRVDDPELDRMTPPNHFNCRSVLVEVLINEPIKKDDLLNAKDVGKARELAGKGFA